MGAADPTRNRQWMEEVDSTHNPQRTGAVGSSRNQECKSLLEELNNSRADKYRKADSSNKEANSFPLKEISSKVISHRNPDKVASSKVNLEMEYNFPAKE